MLPLSDFLAAVRDPEATGSIVVTYTGAARSLLAYEGIEDRATGYSASPALAEIDTNPEIDPPAPGLVELAAPGIMFGAPKPSIAFPANTVFTPYAYLLNTTPDPLSVDLLISPGQGGGVLVKLGTVALAPGAAVQPDLPGYSGRPASPPHEEANLVLRYQGRPGDLDVETGSIDQTRNYVFEVAPTLESETIGKTLCYWTVAGDNDSMITIWNYTSAPADQLLTFYFARGKYKLPFHLAPGETRTLSLKAVKRDQVRDDDGHTLPVNITEGSALLTAASGEVGKMHAAVSSASFNVRNGTCGMNCTTCTGVAGFTISPSTITIGVRQPIQMQGVETYNTGTVQNTTISPWASTAQSVATVTGSGMTTGVGGGKSNISELLFNVPVYAGTVCSQYPVACPTAGQMGASSSVTVQVPSAITVTNDTIATLACTYSSTKRRVVTYQIMDQTGSPMDSSVVIRENVPTTFSSCSNTQVQTGNVCQLSSQLQPGGLSNFNDFLSPGCPSSASVPTPCGFTFQSQQWQWCQPNGSQTSIGR